MPKETMIGKRFSHYELVRKLGEGGMGVVYQARDLRLERFVALKFLSGALAQDEDAYNRFKQEARAASALDHPNICTIHSIEETEDGHVFIVMAYYDGETLRQREARGLPAFEEIAHVGLQVCSGLAKAHSGGIVHRDIKPGNLFVTKDGIVKILDFGLAQLAGGKVITRPGAAIGTAAYMSPEQARGRNVDHRTDLWSLGVVLYEMAASQLPFQGQFDLGCIHAILHEACPPLANLRPDLPPDFHRLVHKALSKDPVARQQSAAEMSDALLALHPSGWSLAGLPMVVRPPSGSGQVRRLPSIAVMAFANLTHGEEHDYFSDGLTEELITALAQIEGLRVVSRTSAFQFKGKALDVRQVGKQLNVEVILEGSVRRAGDRLRVTAQLINASDGYQLWSQRFDRELKDIFAIQDEIARSIADSLRVRLRSSTDVPVVRRVSSSMSAYHHYLRGRYHWNKQTEEDLRKAFEYFGKSIAEDPRCASAHAGLADCYTALGFWSVLPAAEVWPKAKESALRALELDESLATVHISLGYVQSFFEHNWKAAGEHFLRAQQFGPGDPNAHYARGIYSIQLARFEDAQAAMQIALELDPLSLFVNAGVAWGHYYARKFEEALAAAAHALELDPNHHEALLIRGLSLLQLARVQEAISEFENLRASSGGNPLIVSVLGVAHALAGEKEKALELLAALNEMEKQHHVMAVTRGLIHIALGEMDAAFEWLNRAADQHEALLCYLNVLPLYDPIRFDPRFPPLLAKVGLPDISLVTR